MEENTNTGANNGGTNPTNPSPESKTNDAGGTTGNGQQSAKAELQVVADRAKSATQGFDIQKIFVGRVDNMNYLYGALASIVLGFTIGMIPVIGFLVMIPLAVLGFGLTARRFHDINITGWASLILFVPFLGLFAVIYLCWKHGDVAANPFGAVPDPKRDFFKAVLNT